MKERKDKRLKLIRNKKEDITMQTTEINIKAHKLPL